MAKIAVIGSGPMGLSAAYELLKKSHEVIVFEEDEVVGGMTASFDFSGKQIERYYHFICQPDKALLNLLRELKIYHKLRWKKVSMGYYYNGELYRWGSAFSLLKFTPLSLYERLRYGILAFTSIYRKSWKALDNKDAVSWIKRWIGERAYDVVWKSLFELKFYHLTTNLSAAWIWSRINRVGNSPKTGYLEGGSETLLKALVTRISDLGGAFQMSSKVLSVEINSEIKGGLCGSIKILSTHRGNQDFDAVVSTIPLPYVPSLFACFSSELKDQYNALCNIAVVCVVVELSRKVTDNFWLNINDQRMDIPGIIEYSNLSPMENTLVYIPFYMPHNNSCYSDSDEVFIYKVIRYLKLINPDIADEEIKAVGVNRYRYAQPICPPRYLQSLPPVCTPVLGIYVADTSSYYPQDRSISESISMGRRVAAMVEKDIALSDF